MWRILKHCAFCVTPTYYYYYYYTHCRRGYQSQFTDCTAIDENNVSVYASLNYWRRHGKLFSRQNVPTWKCSLHTTHFNHLPRVECFPWNDAYVSGVCMEGCLVSCELQTFPKFQLFIMYSICKQVIVVRTAIEYFYFAHSSNHPPPPAPRKYILHTPLAYITLDEYSSKILK